MLKVYIIILIITLISVIDRNDKLFSCILKEKAVRTNYRSPTFIVYPDNYIITGASLNKMANKRTADATCQISNWHLITKKNLSLKILENLTYIQKALWNICDVFSPFGLQIIARSKG